MKTSKSFDCVQMKNEIQAKSQARRAGMTEAQRQSDMDKQLESSNSLIAKWWREIKSAKAVPDTRSQAKMAR